MNKTQVVAGLVLGASIGAIGYFGYSLYRDRLPEGVVEVTIEDPVSDWDVKGFVTLEPPVYLPVTADEKGRIEVALRIPEGATVEVVEHPADERPTLRFPAGTIADRLEYRKGLRGDDEVWQVADVRGTEIEPVGAERFRLFRPLHKGGGQPLFGYTWPRGEPDVHEAVMDRFAAAMQKGRGFTKPPRKKARARTIEGFRQRGACAACHIHGKPESQKTPRRATDASGFYVPQSVLFNDAPLEAHRARDINHTSPFIDIGCPDGTPAKKVQDKGVHFECDGGQVPRATLRIVEALAAGDVHAKGVCRSRQYLYDHLDDAGRKVFAPRFAECGIAG